MSLGGWSRSEAEKALQGGEDEEDFDVVVQAAHERLSASEEAQVAASVAQGLEELQALGYGESVCLEALRDSLNNASLAKQSLAREAKEMAEQVVRLI
jgi:hypothetical protein